MSSSQADIARMNVEGRTDGLGIVGVGRNRERFEIGRQIIESCGSRELPPSQGMRSCGGARFWPAETRS
jgi:hypothetical protein